MHGSRRGASFVFLGALLSLALFLLWRPAGGEEHSASASPAAVRELRPAPLEAAAVRRGPEVAVADGASPAPARDALPPEPVYLYQLPTHDPGFPGERWELGLGTANAGEAFPDDGVRAVEVPAGLQVTLFHSPDGGGARVVLGAGRHNLAPYRFDDRLSSVRVARYGQDAASPAGPADRVVLYEGSDLADGERGREWLLGFPRDRSTQLFSSADGDFDAFAASSAWVPAGYELTLFVEPDGRGAAMVLGPGLHELTLVGFNDRAQSARVRRIAKL